MGAFLICDRVGSKKALSDHHDQRELFAPETVSRPLIRLIGSLSPSSQGLRRVFLAPLTRFERVAFRLGVQRTAFFASLPLFTKFHKSLRPQGFSQFPHPDRAAPISPNFTPFQSVCRQICRHDFARIFLKGGFPVKIAAHNLETYSCHSPQSVRICSIISQTDKDGFSR